MTPLRRHRPRFEMHTTHTRDYICLFAPFFSSLIILQNKFVSQNENVEKANRPGRMKFRQIIILFARVRRSCYYREALCIATIAFFSLSARRDDRYELLLYGRMVTLLERFHVKA